MTNPNQRNRELRQALAEAAADAAGEVAGVARLRPDLAATLRGAGGFRELARTPRALPAVRLTAASGGRDRWQAGIELRIALHRGHRAVDVCRAVHTAVTEAAGEVLPEGSRSTVTVIVTGIV
ncbi:Asp23/Gls24 family envelope stress response protein [Streptomyces tardus]|uniref:Asp23/Gls24 family envelope stress response protein n=1 Tax=Streptomyces tardus TaxID=2780544 RepID=UPI0027E4EF2C|nr:Asp23/Gls24 family envelope stress response protein [Streptomyces tardus]